jgi:serine/threonine-protein kinase
MGDRYEIIKVLGEGGNSTAFLAKDKTTGRKVTIKQLKTIDGKISREAELGLRHEAEVLKYLDDPAIPKLVEFLGDTLVLEYIPGKSIEKKILEGGVFDEKTTRTVALELVRIFEYLHSCKRPVIYRDLKPSNVVIKPDGHVALIDFGTARFYKKSDTADTNNLGTLGYAAPEQYGNLGQTDKRTDIYCFGMTLLQMISGVDPRDDDAVMLYKSKGIKGISAELMLIIDKCTRPDREDRFNTCAEVEEALRTYPRQKRKRIAKGVFKAFLISGAAAFIISTTTVKAEDIKAFAKTDFEGRLPAIKERFNNVRIRLDDFFEKQMGDRTDRRIYE